MGAVVRADRDGPNQPLLSPKHNITANRSDDFVSKFWVETQKLWLIVGPSIFSRVASFSMNIITQAFAGHLGDVELASISIANTVIVGFNFGLLVSHSILNQYSVSSPNLIDPLFLSSVLNFSWVWQVR